MKTRRESFKKALSRVNKDYRRALKKLSES
jgi:hypothetical protein